MAIHHLFVCNLERKDTCQKCVHLRIPSHSYDNIADKMKLPRTPTNTGCELRFLFLLKFIFFQVVTDTREASYGHPQMLMIS